MIFLFSVEFCFSFFFRTCFYFLLYFLFCGFFLAVTGNWEALSYYVFQNPNNYFLYMFMTSLRREPVRRQQNCPIATIWCRIKCVLTKIGPFKNWRFDYYKEFKIWFFSVLSSSASRLFFFFRTCFYFVFISWWRMT